MLASVHFETHAIEERTELLRRSTGRTVYRVSGWLILMLLAGCGYQTIPHAQRCSLQGDIPMGESFELMLSVADRSREIEVFLSSGPPRPLQRGLRPGLLLLMPPAHASSFPQPNRGSAVHREIESFVQRESMVLLGFPDWQPGDELFLEPALSYARAAACLDDRELFVVAPRELMPEANRLVCLYPGRLLAAVVLEPAINETWKQLNRVRRTSASDSRGSDCNDKV